MMHNCFCIYEYLSAKVANFIATVEYPTSSLIQSFQPTYHTGHCAVPQVVQMSVVRRGTMRHQIIKYII